MSTRQNDIIIVGSIEKFGVNGFLDIIAHFNNEYILQDPIKIISPLFDDKRIDVVKWPPLSPVLLCIN